MSAESSDDRIKRLAASGGWIGVDFDGALARYDGWKDGSLGEPIPLMVERVKRWLAMGVVVQVFTARVSDGPDCAEEYARVSTWTLDHIGQALPITNRKDHKMIELWDDRAVQVVPNTGKRVDELLAAERDEARKWVRNLTQNAHVLTCAFCGDTYPPGTPDSNNEALTAHIKVCVKHPMREAEAEVVRLRQACAEAHCALTAVLTEPAMTVEVREPKEAADNEA